MIEKTLTIPESILQAQNMKYDNSSSGLAATDVQAAIDEIKENVNSASGGDADTVNGHTVESDVPANAVFTDTVYDDSELVADITELKNSSANKVSVRTGNFATAEGSLEIYQPFSVPVTNPLFSKDANGRLMCTGGDGNMYSINICEDLSTGAWTSIQPQSFNFQPIKQVIYSESYGCYYALIGNGMVYISEDFENWISLSVNTNNIDSIPTKLVDATDGVYIICDTGEICRVQSRNHTLAEPTGIIYDGVSDMMVLHDFYILQGSDIASAAIFLGTNEVEKTLETGDMIELRKIVYWNGRIFGIDGMGSLCMADARYNAELETSFWVDISSINCLYDNGNETLLDDMVDIIVVDDSFYIVGNYGIYRLNEDLSVTTMNENQTMLNVEVNYSAVIDIDEGFLYKVGSNRVYLFSYEHEDMYISDAVLLSGIFAGRNGVDGVDGIDGEPGEKGDQGVTFTPSVSDDGYLSWSNDGDLENPETVKIVYQTEIGEAVSKADEAVATATEANATANSASDVADEALSIAKGRNQAHVFATTESMQTALADEANKGTWQVGDNLYIEDLDVPDWWIAAVLEEADADTGYFYKIAQLETQKVDLTEVNEAIDAVEAERNLYTYTSFEQLGITDISTLTSWVNLIPINSRLVVAVTSSISPILYSNGLIPANSTGALEITNHGGRGAAFFICDNNQQSIYTAISNNMTVYTLQWHELGKKNEIDTALAAKVQLAEGGKFASLADFWTYYEAKIANTGLCAFIRFNDTTGWTPNANWWRAWVSSQNRLGNGAYSVTGCILLTNSTDMYIGTVTGGSVDTSDLAVSWQSFLPLTNGVSYKNLFVEHTNAVIQASDGTHSIALAANSYTGLYDHTFDKWVLRINPDASELLINSDSIIMGGNVKLKGITNGFELPVHTGVMKLVTGSDGYSLHLVYQKTGSTTWTKSGLVFNVRDEGSTMDAYFNGEANSAKALVDQVATVSELNQLQGVTGNVQTQLNALKTVMTGATTSSAGTAGLVPAPAAGDTSRVLQADGTWGLPALFKVSEDSIAAGASLSVTIPNTKTELWVFRDAGPNMAVVYMMQASHSGPKYTKIAQLCTDDDLNTYHAYTITETGQYSVSINVPNNEVAHYGVTLMRYRFA